MIDNRRLATAVLLFCFLSGPAAYAQSSSMGLNAPQLYEKGMNSLLRVGVYRSDINALDYIRRSAELGYAPAQVLFGYFYDTGNRLSQNSGEAADWYKKAAKQDDHLAAWLLGRLYYTGFGASLYSANVTGVGRPEHVPALGVTDEVLPILGVTPPLGRSFTRADDEPGSSDTVMITYGYWRSKFGGMDVSDAKRLKALEAENAKLKKLLAESMLENEVSREALRKKW